ncbi:MAG: 7-cyano-7-deazaguanine synthase QueC [Pirellulaceae bacterium]
MSKPAVVLLSGGLDSATCLAIARQQGFQPYAISFRYGQRHQYELQCAQAVAAHLGVAKHVVVDIDLAQFGGSALTSPIDVPKHASVDQIGDDIPVTYVPARNTVFLSLALAWAETLDARDLFIGVNALDYSGYPDCRPAFIEQFQKLANLATKVGVQSGGDAIKVHAPLIDLTKGEIIATGLQLGVDYSLTQSCYDPRENLACGECDACLLRLKGFGDNQMLDPARYVRG